MMFSRLRASLNASLFLSWLLGLLGPYVTLLAVWPRKRHHVAGLFFKGCLKLTGLRVTVKGWPAPLAAMYAVNHVSYLDIPVLGSLLGDSVFVAKREVASWPLFGFLARLAGTEFIWRNPVDARNQCHRLAKRLKNGDALIVFPEGSSTDGKGVDPFKSTLFATLDLSETTRAVQPVTIVYENEHSAWYGDVTLTPHLWRMLGRPGGGVTVTFHDPVAHTDFPDRKALAKHCEDLARDTVAAARFKPSTPLPLAAE